MATRVAELYAELTLRDNSLNDGLEGARDNLNQLGQASDQAATQAQRGAARQAEAYRNLQRETERAYNTARTQASRAVTATERVEVVQRRLADAVREHGRESEQAQRAERQLTQARGDAERITRNAERANDTYRISLQRTEQSQRDASRAAERAGTSLRDLMQTSERAGRSMREAVPDEARVNRFSNALTRAGEGMASLGGSAGSGMGGEFVSGFAGRVQGLGGKGGPIVAALAGVAVLGVAAGGALAMAVKDGMAREADLAKVQAGLGVDDATMKAIGAAASKSYTDGFGESVAGNATTISEAIKAGLLSKDDSGGVIVDTTNKLQTLADVMGEDISAAARAAGQAVKTGIAKDGVEAMDLLVKAEQSGLNVADDMLDTTIEYGTQFAKIGLTGQEAFALMNQTVQAGARDADTAADAWKEFAIRTIDGSKASSDAYQALGLSAEEYTSKMAQGGDVSATAMREILTEMNKLEDPVKKNAVAVGLFGTKAEDLGDAFSAMNLDTAVREFGEVAGATQNAADIIGGTSAAKLEAARRSIEESMMGVKGALADAFGPALQKVAEWVDTHKPEILSFFVSLADAGLATLDGMLGFASGTLRAFADMQEGIGDTVGKALQFLGGLQTSIGGFLEQIPGMEDAGRAMSSFGEGVKTYGEQMDGAADKARELADGIDNTVRPAMQGIRTDFQESGAAAVNSAEMFRALGDTVTAVPTEHGIQINENTPETRARLEALGLDIRKLPNGQFEVFARTEGGQQRINDFVAQNEGRQVNMIVALRESGSENLRQKYATKGENADGSIMLGSFADGGTRLPAQAKIQMPRKNLIQWAEEETEGEAFIPLAISKRGRSEQILEEVARRFGKTLVSEETAKILRGDPKSLTNETDPTGWRALLGGDYNGKLRQFGIEEDHPLVNAVLGARSVINDGNYDERLRAGAGIEEDHPLVGSLLDFHKFTSDNSVGNALDVMAKSLGFQQLRMADGGVVDSLTAIAKQTAPGLQVTSSVRNEPGSYHGTGQAVDFSNGSGNTDEQLAFANYMADNYKAQLAELIYDDPRFDKNIKDGEFVPKSFYANAGDHTHHVHVAAKEALSLDPPSASTNAPAVDPNSKQGIANRIIAEGKRRGMSDREIKSAVMASLAESDLQDLDHGDRDSDGVLQQRPSQGWGSADETVEQDVNQYYDALQKVQGREGMSEAQMAQAVQRSAFSDGSNYQARADEADQYISGYTDSTGTSGSTPDTSSSPSFSGGTQDVRVTNFSELVDALKQAGESETPERQPRVVGNLRMYANGDIRNGHEPQIARPGDYRVFGEDETDGEAYIPFAVSKRARALAIWRETGRRLGVAEFSGGGFGGYSGPDTEDYMKPKNLYDAAALATGIGFTAVSGASNLLEMAQSGNWDLSKLVPSFDTSSNTIPGLSKAFEGMTQQLEEITDTLQKGGMIQVDIDVDSNGVPTVSFTKAGLA